MSTYTVAQARNNLSRLIAAAERGEDVRIHRNGKPAVRIVPEARTSPKLDVEALKRRQVTPSRTLNIVEMLEEMWQDRPW